SHKGADTDLTARSMPFNPVQLSFKSVNNSTFDASSIDSTTVGEKLFRPTENEEENGDDGPVVFICAKCKLPVGDSLSWDGSEDDLNQIRLKRVTDNVMIGKENRLYEASKKSLCLVVDLICRGCHSVLGMVYTSTPKNLDHKRFTFCFSVNYYCCFSLSAFPDDVLLWEKQNVSRNEQIFCSKAHCKLIISPNAG
uniref:Protein Mis18-alpha n=1 Tax=Maylandia zebra TaxID=106582 RepID=A0A3P9DE96_9CICH